MARFDTSGLDDLIWQMRAMGQECGPVAEAMVNASVGAIKEEWIKSAASHGHIDTGDMINSIGIGPGPVNAGSVIYRDVYPQGSDRKGVRNATKAFVLNYGRSNLAGSHWVEDADDRSADPVQTVCESIWNEFINGHQ